MCDAGVGLCFVACGFVGVCMCVVCVVLFVLVCCCVIGVFALLRFVSFGYGTFRFLFHCMVLALLLCCVPCRFVYFMCGICFVAALVFGVWCWFGSAFSLCVFMMRFNGSVPVSIVVLIHVAYVMLVSVSVDVMFRCMFLLMVRFMFMCRFMVKCCSCLCVFHVAVMLWLCAVWCWYVLVMCGVDSVCLACLVCGV